MFHPESLTFYTVGIQLVSVEEMNSEGKSPS